MCAEVEQAYDFYAQDDYVIQPNQEDLRLAKFNEYQFYFDQIEPYLHPNSRVLDVGCGDGQILKMIRDRVGFVQGVEITPAQVAQLRKEGISVWDRPLDQIQPEEPFDIICMHALLEHVPNVRDFLKDLKRFICKHSKIFISVPHGLDPLTSFYDVESYRRFFYRQYHLYYFTERSMERLMDRVGYNVECSCTIMASLTNHFHWLYLQKGQRGREEFTSVLLPVPLRREYTPRGTRFLEIVNQVDDFYRRRLEEEGVGDLLHCRAELKP
jgi:SAM-dependent methyltransferase